MRSGDDTGTVGFFQEVGGLSWICGRGTLDTRDTPSNNKLPQEKDHRVFVYVDS